LLTISTSLRMQFKAAARTKLVAPLLSCASNARTTPSGFDMMDECVSVSRTCVLHGDALLLGKSCTTALATISPTLSRFVELGQWETLS
jgi:hypothetical protein